MISVKRYHNYRWGTWRKKWIIRQPSSRQDTQKYQFFSQSRSWALWCHAAPYDSGNDEVLCLFLFTDGEKRPSRHIDRKQPWVTTMKGVCGALMRQKRDLIRSSLNNRGKNLSLISDHNFEKPLVALTLENKRRTTCQNWSFCWFVCNYACFSFHFKFSHIVI